MAIRGGGGFAWGGHKPSGRERRSTRGQIIICLLVMPGLMLLWKTSLFHDSIFVLTLI